MNGSSVVLIALLTAVLTAGGTVYVIERYGILRAPPVPDAVVPELHGMPESDARASAAAGHLALFVASKEQSSDAKSGTVVRQSIGPGQHVPRESSVSVVLAEEVPRVPGVTGVTVAEATQRLEQRGFHMQLGGTMADAKLALGLVVDQSPKADSPSTKGGTVVVQVSSGPGDVEVPKLVGLALTQAKTDLEKLGVKPTVRWVAMAETPTFVVLNQKPAAGEKVKPGAEVFLTVCR